MTAPSSQNLEFSQEYFPDKPFFSLPIENSMNPGKWKISIYTEGEKKLGSVEWDVR
jgi:hypothetical protein